MSPLSSDPARRERQLRNLVPGARTAPEGNDRTRTHGGYATVAVDRLDEKTLEVFAALAADAPLRHAGELPAADAAQVRLAAEALCRLDNVSGYLRDKGWQDGKGRPRVTVLELERRLRSEIADHLDALGMSPRSRARLGLDLARSAGAQPQGGMDLTALTDEELTTLRRLTAKAQGAGPVIDADPVGGER